MSERVTTAQLDWSAEEGVPEGAPFELVLAADPNPNPKPKPKPNPKPKPKPKPKPNPNPNQARPGMMTLQQQQREQQARQQVLQEHGDRVSGLVCHGD